MKMHVIYEQPKNKEGFEEHYFNVHIPLAQKIPNLKNLSYQKVLQAQNTDAHLYLIAELEFESLNVFQESMSSKEGKETQRDVANLLEYLHKPPVITISE